MRLIDADALKKHITEIFEIEEKVDKKWAMGLKYSLKIIDNASSVEINKCLDTDIDTDSENKYKRAFEIACDLLNGDKLYGIDTDNLFALIMQENGIVSTLQYQKFILEHLDRFDDNDEVRLKAVERLGW